MTGAPPQYASDFRPPPVDAEGFYYLGVELAGRREHEKALTAFAESLALERQAATYVAQGKSLRELGRWDDALASLYHARALDPAEESAVVELAETLLGMARPTEARDVAMAALAGAPGLATARLVAAKTEVALGRVDSALFHWAWLSLECDAGPLYASIEAAAGAPVAAPAALALRRVAEVRTDLDGAARARILARADALAGHDKQVQLPPAPAPSLPPPDTALAFAPTAQFHGFPSLPPAAGAPKGATEYMSIPPITAAYGSPTTPSLPPPPHGSYGAPPVMGHAGPPTGSYGAMSLPPPAPQRSSNVGVVLGILGVIFLLGTAGLSVGLWFYFSDDKGDGASAAVAPPVPQPRSTVEGAPSVPAASPAAPSAAAPPVVPVAEDAGAPDANAVPEGMPSPNAPKPAETPAPPKKEATPPAKPPAKPRAPSPPTETAPCHPFCSRQ